MGVSVRLNKQNFLMPVALIVTLLSPLLGISEGKYFFIFADSFYFPLSSSLFFLIYFCSIRLKPVLTRVTVIDAFVFLYFSYNVIITWISNTCGFSSSVSTISSPFFLYLVLRHYVASENQNRLSSQNYFIISILVTGYIPIIVGMLEYGGAIPLVVNFKITGGFLNPGMYANFIASIFPFALSIVSLKGNGNKWVKRAACLFLLAATGILVVSNARSAWVGSSISAIYVFSHNRRLMEAVKKIFNSNIKILIVIIAVTAGIVIASVFLYNLKKESAEGRLFIWKLCVDLIKEKPIFGIGNGYNSFPKAFNARQRAYFAQHPHDTEYGLLANDAKYAFNDYLQLMIETGIIGVTLFFCIIFFALKGEKNPQQPSLETGYLSVASKSSIIATLVCALFSYPLKSISNCALFFVFIAYISSSYPPLQHRLQFRRIFLPVGSVLLALWVSSIFAYQICLIRCCYKWKDAYIYYETGDMQHALEKYKVIRPFFNSYFLFMFNYGSVLYVNGKFDEAIHILESAKQLNGTYDTFLNIGGCYEMTRQFDKAEDCYIRASNSIPHKLSPKYKLFKLYIKTNKSPRAHHIASLIKDMNIKIDTPVANQIKREIVAYLKENRVPLQSGQSVLGR